MLFGFQMPKSLGFTVCDFFSPSRRGSRHEGPVCSYCCSKYQSPQDGLVQKVRLEFHFFTHFIQEYSTCDPLPLVGGQSSVGLTVRIKNCLGKVNDVRDVSVNLKSLGNSYWIVSFITCGLFKEYCGSAYRLVVCSNSKITNIDIYIFLSESRHYNLFHMSSESRHYNLFHKYHFMLFFLGTTFVEDNLSITTLVDCHSALQLSWYFISQCNFCSV